MRTYGSFGSIAARPLPTQSGAMMNPRAMMSHMQPFYQMLYGEIHRDPKYTDSFVKIIIANNSLKIQYGLYL